MSDAIHAAMEVERQKAIDALGRYKFWMFGYHASGWVKLSRLCGCKHANPFSAFVKMARKEPTR
jgi:hypothetical protein